MATFSIFCSDSSTFTFTVGKIGLVEVGVFDSSSFAYDYLLGDGGG